MPIVFLIFFSPLSFSDETEHPIANRAVAPLEQAQCIATSAVNETLKEQEQLAEVNDLLKESELLLGPSEKKEEKNPFAALSIEQLNRHIQDPFWKNLRALVDTMKEKVEEFKATTAETVEHYSLFTGFYDEQSLLFEQHNRQWSTHCEPHSQLSITESAENQSRAMAQIDEVNIKVAQQQLHALCMNSLSQLTSIKFTLDELNGPIDRLLDLRIERIKNAVP